MIDHPNHNPGPHTNCTSIAVAVILGRAAEEGAMPAAAGRGAGRFGGGMMWAVWMSE